MTKRVVGAALFGTGVFSLVAAAGLAFLITPLVSKIPYDLEPPDSTLDAPAAHYQPGERLTGRFMVDAMQPRAVRASSWSVPMTTRSSHAARLPSGERSPAP